MNQKDYNRTPNFRRMPGPMGQPMGQPMNNGYQQPMGGYQQPMNNGYQQPMGGYQQPMNQQPMNSGNFAPRPSGNFAQPAQNPMMQKQMQDMARMNNATRMMQNNSQRLVNGYDRGDTMNYEYNGENWNDIKLGDVRDNMNQREAEESVAQMDQFIEKMQDTIDLSVASTGNIASVTSAARMLSGLLKNPKEWLPTNAPKETAKALVEKGNVIAKYLDIYAFNLDQLK